MAGGDLVCGAVRGVICYFMYYVCPQMNSYYAHFQIKISHLQIINPPQKLFYSWQFIISFNQIDLPRDLFG